VQPDPQSLRQFESLPPTLASSCAIPRGVWKGGLTYLLSVSPGWRWERGVISVPLPCRPAEEKPGKSSRALKSSSLLAFLQRLPAKTLISVKYAAGLC